ncbi:hypothetical protein D3C78_1467270 [compost metagenome]
MLEELIALEHGLEGVAADEVVVDPVHLTRAHTAGGVRNGYAHAGHVVEQGLDQTGLAGTGGGGNDVQGAGHGANFLSLAGDC